MPTVSVGRDRLFAALGETYTQEQFDELCFSFGIELDDVTTEKAIIRKEKHLEEEADDDEEVIYKIEVPANRYDLLCLEGLAQALRVFIKKEKTPVYTLSNVSKESMLKIHVKKETSTIRPYVVCAVLRNVTFDEASYNSFIDLQDKLHQNICRQRTLVAIGTHDLDTLQAPFSYEALPPEKINFVPLKQEKNFRADELMECYKSDLKLKKFLHIIEGSPVYPVIYDHKRTVLSLPPIINGAHSAITLKTKNVFIECTATDLTKAKIVLNTVVTAFSSYCVKKYEVEPVEVIYDDGKSFICPDLSEYNIEVPLSYITGLIGADDLKEADVVTSLLNRMQLRAERCPSDNKEQNIRVSVPPTRSDILHPCDVMEVGTAHYSWNKDVAIAFGYNNIPKRNLPSLKPLALNELENLIRVEVVRTSLMPGALKCIKHSYKNPKPIKIFEVGEVSCLDETKDVGATNRRLLGALYCGTNSGFELIHSLVDRVMEVMGTMFKPDGDNSGYHLQKAEAPEFLAGRQANIIYKGKHIGIFGIVHPQVLSNFDIPYPCSFMELDIEAFLEEF
ncbi:Phenylalanine--tRNA ligase beta subunit, cytoplasmic [Linum perenne]